VNRAEEAALLDLFATVDAVFTEPDAFDPNKTRIGHGRIYRAWKRARRTLAAQSYAPLTSRLPERSERGNNTP
jgi:hypothetical protein